MGSREIQVIALGFTQVSLPHPVRVVLTNKSGKDLKVVEKGPDSLLKGVYDRYFYCVCPP